VSLWGLINGILVVTLAGLLAWLFLALRLPADKEYVDLGLGFTTLKFTKNTVVIAWVVIFASRAFLSANFERFRSDKISSLAVRRKTQTAKNVKRLEKFLKPPGGLGPEAQAHLEELRTEVLQLIVSHVADRLLEQSPEVLFASLVVIPAEDPKKALVFSRSNERRRDAGDEYAINEVFCERALKERRAVSCGWLRLYKGARDRDYEDILSIPLKLKKSAATGVVNVDSKRPFHFFRKEAKLQTGLDPYIAMIELTIPYGGQNAG